MTKKETTILIVGVIGFLADIIGIATFIYSANAQNNLNITISSQIIFFISNALLFYFWFVATYFFVRKNYLKDLNSPKKPRDRAVLRITTISFLVIIIPVSIIINSLLSVLFFDSLALLYVEGVLIYEGLKNFFVMLHPEMERYISRKGSYVCIKDFGKIKKGEKIQIIKRTYPEYLYLVPLIGWIFCLGTILNEEYSNFSALDPDLNEIIIKEYEIINYLELQ